MPPRVSYLDRWRSLAVGAAQAPTEGRMSRIKIVVAAVLLATTTAACNQTTGYGYPSYGYNNGYWRKGSY